MTDDRAAGLRVRVKRQNLDGQYMITPNALFRGEGIYEGLDPYERILLGAGLSCDDGWETTLGDIEDWLPGLGRDRHRRIRRRLRERGFLSMKRTQIPAGQPSAGKYIWTFSFLMDPLPVEDRDELQAKKTTPGADALEIRASAPDDETAGQPMDGFPGHRSAGHRHPGPGDQGDVYKEEKNHSLEEELPPYPPDDPSADVEAAAVPGRGASRFDEATQKLLESAVAETRALKPRWTEAAIRKAMRQALDADRTPDSVAWAIVHAAKDPTSSAPGRLTSDRWWDLALRERHVTAPAPRDLGPRCQEPGDHRSQPADRCLMCAADKRVAGVEAARAAKAEADAAAESSLEVGNRTNGPSATEIAKQAAREAARGALRLSRV